MIPTQQDIKYRRDAMLCVSFMPCPLPCIRGGYDFSTTKIIYKQKNKCFSNEDQIRICIVTKTIEY